jgi:RNA polymerase sigma-70 factor (ECF subfamily)
MDAVTVLSDRPIIAALCGIVRDCASGIVRFAEQVREKAKGLGVSTEDLIRRFQRGQPRAFEALYDRFKDYVYRTAFFITRNGNEAEDATQEAFLDVLRALPNYRVDGPARFETWLYRVTVNRCRSRMRRKRLPSAEWDDIEERLERIPEKAPYNEPEKETLRQERAAALWKSVDALPESHRTVILLRYQQELSYGEIAQALGISEGTVKSRLYHAHHKLKAALESVEIEERA